MISYSLGCALPSLVYFKKFSNDVFIIVLGIEPWPLCALGKRSAAEL